MKRWAFSKTISQMRDRSKTVTRRRHRNLTEPGTRILAIEKGMGLPKGAKHVPIGVIEVVSSRWERLGDITPEDIEREGFPGMSREDFFRLFDGDPHEPVVRVEFRHVEE